jgi:hypothetical protein
MALVAEYFEGSPGGTGGLQTLHGRVAKAIADVATLDGEVRLLPCTLPPANDRRELLRHANVLRAEIRQIEFEAGTDRCSCVGFSPISVALCVGTGSQICTVGAQPND